MQTTRLGFLLGYLGFVHSNIISELYQLCHHGGLPKDTTPLTLTRTRSRLECAKACVVTVTCAAFDAYPDEGQASYNCSLYAESPSLEICCSSSYSPSEGLNASDTACDNNSTVYRKSLPVPQCQEGRVLIRSRCVCPIEWSGPDCQRRIRDCSEPFENGYDKTYSGAYLIQPLNVSTPFFVLCDFRYGGITAILRRMSSSFNKNMTEMRPGFGTAGPDDNFFVGLDNMHLTLHQAAYTNNIFVLYDNFATGGSGFYDDFHVADASESFRLTFSKFWSDRDFANIVEGAAGPYLFSTADNDPNGCAASRGYPGWFGVNCSGHSAFNDALVWPVNGTDQPLQLLGFHLTRQGAFVEA